MDNPVPLFVNGEFVEVHQLEADGRAFVREFDFRDVGRLPVYPYPHPETITLPRYLPGLQRATNMGVIFLLRTSTARSSWYGWACPRRSR